MPCNMALPPEVPSSGLKRFLPRIGSPGYHSLLESGFWWQPLLALSGLPHANARSDDAGIGVRQSKWKRRKIKLIQRRSVGH